MKHYSAFVVLVLSFATALSILGYDAGFANVGFLLALKDVSLVLGLFIVVAWRLVEWRRPENHLQSVDLLVACLITVNLLSFFLSPADLGLKALNLRRNLSLFLFFWVFFFAGRRKAVLRTIAKYSKYALAAAMVFGVFEYFMPDWLWDKCFDMPGYWKTIALDPFGTDKIALSGRFYSWDWIALSGGVLRRMVSIYAEPTTMAAFFIAMFCWSYVKRGIYSRLLIFAVGLLTLSKFFLISSITVILLRRYSGSLGRHLMLFCYLGCLLLAAGALLLGLSQGAFAHLSGIVSLTELYTNKMVLGHGIGAAGNYTDVDSDITAGAESGLGNIVAQLGIGAIAYLWAFSFLYARLLDRWNRYGKTEYLAGIMMLISWVVSFFLSASSLGESGNAFFFIFIGCILAADPDTLTADQRRRLPHLKFRFRFFEKALNSAGFSRE